MSSHRTEESYGMNQKEIRMQGIYVEDVLLLLEADWRTKSSIRKEIHERLDARRELGDDRSAEEILGSVDRVAEEYASRYGLVKKQAPPRIGWKRRGRYSSGGYEYCSESKLFGLPLVHIVAGDVGRTGTYVAKGIIAIGPFAIGLFSLGGFSIGLFSLGGVSIGLLLALGGLAVGGFGAIGGAAISYGIAVGGFAMAYHLAIGSAAISHHVAIGVETAGSVCGYFKQMMNADFVDSRSIPGAYFLPWEAGAFLEDVSRIPNFGSVYRHVIEFLIRLIGRIV